MIALVKGYFTRKQKPKNDFSEFFTSASSKEKKKMFKEVIRAANLDQKKLVERYNQMQSKAA